MKHASQVESPISNLSETDGRVAKSRKVHPGLIHQ
ncbi:MAG: hypothetical protein JWN25_3196, partial [Verrucomicrobiales bacterium]|nr:hypothetical protein [Verrucomicrobiales bacterium]